MDSTQKSLNSGFTKYFKWLKDNNVNMSEPGALSGSVIYPGNADNKPISMANFVANKELNNINNAVKVDLPPNTVAGIKKIFVDDLTKEKGFKMPEVPAKFREPSWKLSRDELIFRYAVKNDCPVHELDNGGISKIAEAIKGNFKEQLFGTTSHEYRNLITAMKDYDNTNHVSYHNSAPVKIAANQYLIHKGVTSREQAERLPYPAKDRALLCFDLIDTFQKNEGPEVAKIVPGKLQQVEVNHPIKRVQAIEDSSLVDDDLTLVFTNKQLDGNSVEANKEIDNDNKIENDNEINLEK